MRVTSVGVPHRRDDMVSVFFEPCDLPAVQCRDSQFQGTDEFGTSKVFDVRWRNRGWDVVRVYD